MAKSRVERLNEELKLQREIREIEALIEKERAKAAKLAEKGKKLKEDEVKSLQQTNDKIEKQTKLLDDVVERYERIKARNSDTLTNSKDLLDSLSRVRQAGSIRNFMRNPLEAVIDVRKNMLDVNDAAGAFSKTGAKAFATTALAASAAAAALIQIVKLAIGASQNLTDLARTLDISADNAEELAQQLIISNQYSGLLGNNLDAIVKSAAAVREEFGFATSDLQDQIRLTSILSRNLGLTEQEAAKFNFAAGAAGVSINELILASKSLEDNFEGLSEVGNGFRSTIQDIAKLSEDTLRLYIGQGTALVNAVKQARLLGISLDQANRTSESLLSIEQSLAAESEARVLTGRRLNFDNARYLAIQKDVEGAAREILRQVGSAAEFGNLNKLAQESIAEAVGMTAGELGRALVKQEALAKIGDETLKQFQGLTREQAMQLAQAKGITDQAALDFISQQQRVSVQEKFNDLVLQLQDKVVAVAPAILAIANAVLNAANAIGTILNIPASIAAKFDTATSSAGSVKAQYGQPNTGFGRKFVDAITYKTEGTVQTSMMPTAMLAKSMDRLARAMDSNNSSSTSQDVTVVVGSEVIEKGAKMASRNNQMTQGMDRSIGLDN